MKSAFHIGFDLDSLVVLTELDPIATDLVELNTYIQMQSFGRHLISQVRHLPFPVSHSQFVALLVFCLRPPCLETRLSHVLTSMSKVPFRLTISRIRYRENRGDDAIWKSCCALVWRTDFNDNVLLKNILDPSVYRSRKFFNKLFFILLCAIFFYFFGNEFIILKK